MRALDNHSAFMTELLSDVVHLQHEIYVGLDQTRELNYLLRLVNHSSGHYNFSEAEALKIISEYMKNMYTVRQPATIALICLYVPVFFISLLGNGLLVFIMAKNAHLRRAKNLFLVNLAVADLLVTVICMPLVLGEIVFRLWIYGDVMCKLTGYMQGVSVASSVFTLTALSVDRYLALKVPESVARISGAWPAVIVLATVWLLAAFFMGPLLFVRRVERVDFDSFHITMAYCVEIWERYQSRQAYGVFLLGATYIIPILTIATCYALIGRTLCTGEFHRDLPDSSASVLSGRKRMARMLVVVIAVFMMCWLPYNVCSLSLDIRGDHRDTRALPFTLWLGHAHSAVNPVLYWFLNKTFRTSMRRALCCQLPRKRCKEATSPQGCVALAGQPGVLELPGLSYRSPPLPARREMLCPQPGRSESSPRSSLSRDSPEGESYEGPIMMRMPTISTTLYTSSEQASRESHQSACSLFVHYSRSESRLSISTTSGSGHYITAEGEIAV